jgi:hypothetical protein
MLHGIKKIITSAVDGLRVNVNIDRGRAARKIVRLKARSTATSMNRMNGALRGRRSMLPAAPLCAEAAEPLCAEAAELLCTDAAKPLCTNAASPAGHHAKAADPAGQRAAPLCTLCAGPVGQRAAPLCAEAIAPPLWPVASPSWSHVEPKSSSGLKVRRYSRAWISTTLFFKIVHRTFNTY